MPKRNIMREALDEVQPVLKQVIEEVKEESGDSGKSDSEAEMQRILRRTIGE